MRGTKYFEMGVDSHFIQPYELPTDGKWCHQRVVTAVLGPPRTLANFPLHVPTSIISISSFITCDHRLGVTVNTQRKDVVSRARHAYWFVRPTPAGEQRSQFATRWLES